MEDVLSAGLEQERFKMMNRNWLTDRINISIESFKLPFKKQNNSNQKQKPFHYVIRNDAFLSKGTYNEELASPWHRLKY